MTRREGSLASKVENAIAVFKPTETFTSNDITTLTQVNKARVQMYFSSFAKQGKIICVNREKYPFVYRMATPEEIKAFGKRGYKRNKKTAVKTEQKSVASIDTTGYATPLQIGIGVIELIDSLKRADNHELISLRTKVKQLEGNIANLEATIRNKNATIQEYKTALADKDRQLQGLSNHMVGLKGESDISKGVKLSDLIFNQKK
jgi:uncharacterized coiled-coil protein SlyX